MPSKVEATRRYAGEVVQTEGSLSDTCLALQRERDLTLVHPSDDLAVIAGRGTVGSSCSRRSRMSARGWFPSEGAALSPASPQAGLVTDPVARIPAWWPGP